MVTLKREVYVIDIIIKIIKIIKIGYTPLKALFISISTILSTIIYIPNFPLYISSNPIRIFYKSIFFLPNSYSLAYNNI